MPDITMCTNEDCPQRWQCYRAQATPKETGQSYAKYSPKITAHMGFDCHGFEPIRRQQPENMNRGDNAE